MDHWEEMDLGAIFKRTEPQAMGSYVTHFRAPAQQIVLFVRGWKKWGVSNVEMDFNLDAITLRPCDGGSARAWWRYGRSRYAWRRHAQWRHAR